MEIIKCDHGQDLADTSAGHHVLIQRIKESLFRLRHHFLKELEFGKNGFSVNPNTAQNQKRGKQGQK